MKRIELSDYLLLTAAIGLLFILADMWTVHLIGFKLYDLRDAIAPIWRIG